MIPRLAASLITPVGERYDITRRCDFSSLGVFDEQLEDGLGVLSHSDIDLVLRNQDGFMEKILSKIRPKQICQLIVERETGRRAPKWERLFAGILDLPDSISLDTKTKRISVRVFSYSKLLELGNAENVRRTFAPATASVTAGTKVVDLVNGTTAGMQSGDGVTLGDLTNVEPQVIDRVMSGTQFTTVNAWGHTFVGAALTVDTPYHRNKSCSFLGGAVFEEAGIPEYVISDDVAAYPEPIAQAISTDGIGTAQEPLGLVDNLDMIRVTFATGPRKEATSLVSGFSDGAVTNATIGDWYPYYTADPLFIITKAGVPDNGVYVAWDFPGNHSWSMVSASEILSIQRDDAGVTRTVLHDLLNPAILLNRFMDADGNSCLWISWELNDAYAGPLDKQGITIYDIGADTFTPLRTDASGQLRCVTGAGLLQSSESHHVVFANATTGKLEFYGQAGRTILATIDAPPGTVKLWTLRYFPTLNRLAVIYHYGGKSRLRVWRTPDLSQASDYEIAGSQSMSPFLTGWVDPASGITYPVGYAGGIWFTLSAMQVGIVPYADFSNLSCAAAQAAIAQMMGCFLTVGHDRIGRISPRAPLTVNPYARVLDLEDGQTSPPLECTIRVLSKDWRGSVEVKAKGLDGSDLKPPIAGDRSDSAHRLTLSPDLPMTEAMAIGLGNAMYGWCGRIRQGAEGVKRRIRGALIRPNQQVRLRSRSWLVTRAQTDTTKNIQVLRLDEIVPA